MQLCKGHANDNKHPATHETCGIAKTRVTSNDAMEEKDEKINDWFNGIICF
jgi:hypothetical protein